MPGDRATTTHSGPSVTVSLGAPSRSGREHAGGAGRGAEPRSAEIPVGLVVGMMRSEGAPTALAQPAQPHAIRTPLNDSAPDRLPAGMRVWAEELNVQGSLQPSIVRRALERISPQLRACYVRHGVANNAGSSCRVELTIDERGRARSPIIQGPIGSELAGCLSQSTRRLVSDPPDTGVVRVSFGLRVGR